MSRADYEGFWAKLPHMVVLASDSEALSAFRHQYREEVMGLLSMLHRIGLFGGATNLHAAPPHDCDSCGAELMDFQWFIEGRGAVVGTWMNMCPTCYLARGHSIGWGAGQLYLQVAGGAWRLVCGGDPESSEEECEA